MTKQIMSDQQTSIFGLHLWIVLGITAGAVFVLILFLISLWLTTRSKKPVKKQITPDCITATLPQDNANTSQEIQRLSTIEKQALLLVTVSNGGGPEVSHLGWGHWYTLRELEVATDGFADENVIGQGGYGIVYRGVVADGTQVAVKNLLNNRYFCTFRF